MKGPPSSTNLQSRAEMRSPRWTPSHLRMLTRVLEKSITWRPDLGVAGGFTSVNGIRLKPSDDLVALYELRNEGAIRVVRDLGQVVLTDSGKELLTQLTFET